MNLSLSEQERALLAELLDADLRELKEEINKTETFDYKEELKTREGLLRGLLARLTSVRA